MNREYEMSKRFVLSILAALAVLYITWKDHKLIQSDLRSKNTRETEQKIAMTKTPFVKPDSFKYKDEFDSSNSISAFGVQTHPSQWMVPDS